MSDITAVETLTREHYLRRQYHAKAGPSTEIEDTTVLERWCSQWPDWRGKYWTLTPDADEVLRLHPINVAARRATTPAA
ncbi:hypothetical protein ACQPW1_22855 [Nocardia sp. CA-128927]|uniref:hypothetical protein n=1 Tax=Nocardia sp. CA-128927 TaxID=3239975 RepID=UPI003D98DF1E